MYNFSCSIVIPPIVEESSFVSIFSYFDGKNYVALCIFSHNSVEGKQSEVVITKNSECSI